MLTLLSLVVTAFALLLLVLTLVFVAEVLAECLLPVWEIKKTSSPCDKCVAVLIPAHNEGAGIKLTIEDIKQQLRPGDRLVVVADNCTDDTATVAAASGAEVSIRIDPAKIGKGYALDWGIRYLTAECPDIVIVIDADCRVSDGTIEKLSQECSASGHPVQGLYLMAAAPDSPAVNQQVAQFAWRVKNLVRPLGLRKLNLPCQLMGTGMAFPWKLIQSANLSSGSIVEDMKLGLEFAAKGRAPLFCPSAIVTSTFPTSHSGTRAQRQRWEQGHISLILSSTPKLLLRAIKQRDLKLCAAALDLAVPPLSLLVSILAAAAIGTALAPIMGLSEKPFFITAACLLLAVASIILAWVKHGRDILPLDAVVLIIPYLANKFSFYTALAAGHRVSRWVRTDRS
jgi:cellulose synthase/poly-beta-1,6-N-acetylglucosamine synthase-like glycosyltransferase